MRSAHAERMRQPVPHLFIVPGYCVCDPSIITTVQHCNQAQTRLTFYTAAPQTPPNPYARMHAHTPSCRSPALLIYGVILPPTGLLSSLHYHYHDTTFFYSPHNEKFFLIKKIKRWNRKKNIAQCCCLCLLKRQIFSAEKGWWCLADSSEYYLWKLSNHLDDSLVLASGSRGMWLQLRHITTWPIDIFNKYRV